MNPIWSQLELIEGLAQPTPSPEADDSATNITDSTETDSGGSSVFATNTPIPTPTIVPSPIPTLTPFPTSTPTPTPLPKSWSLPTLTNYLFCITMVVKRLT